MKFLTNWEKETKGVFRYLYVPVCLFKYMSACLHIYGSVCLYVYIFMSVSLSVCPVKKEKQTLLKMLLIQKNLRKIQKRQSSLR